MIEVKIPKKLKVGGFDYRIITDNRTDKELEGRSRWGEVSDREKIIKLYSRQSPQQTSLTFIHEFLHTVDRIYCDDCLSEAECTTMAYGLHQVLEQLKVRFIR